MRIEIAGTEERKEGRERQTLFGNCSRLQFPYFGTLEKKETQGKRFAGGTVLYTVKGLSSSYPISVECREFSRLFSRKENYFPDYLFAKERT